MKKVKITTLLISSFAMISLLAGCEPSLSFSNSGLASSNEPVSSGAPSTKYDKPELVFDYETNGKYLKGETLTLEEHHQTLTINNLTVTDNHGHEFYGIWSFFLYDVNKDGYRDFCFTESVGSGIISNNVSVYDYHNDKEIFRLSERSRFNYFFYINQDNDLSVRKDSNNYINVSTLGIGKLAYETTKGVHVAWENYLGISDYNLRVSYANPYGTILNNHRNEEIYIYNVDSYSLFHLCVELKPKGDKALPDSCPAEFKFTKGTFAMNKIDYNVAGVYYYEIYFDDSATDFELVMEISSFEKTLRFHVDNSDKIPVRVRNLFTWDSVLSLDNLTSFEYDYYYSLIGGMRKIYYYSAKDSLEKAYSFLDELVCEADPEDYVSDFEQEYNYIYRTASNSYKVKVNNKMIVMNNKYYRLRKTWALASDDRTSAYGFTRKLTELTVMPMTDGIATRTISNPEAFTFNRVINSGKKNRQNASHMFEVLGNYYYILDEKTFIDQREEYYYEITSQQDFSLLYH